MEAMYEMFPPMAYKKRATESPAQWVDRFFTNETGLGKYRRWGGK